MTNVQHWPRPAPLPDPAEGVSCVDYGAIFHAVAAHGPLTYDQIVDEYNRLLDRLGSPARMRPDEIRHATAHLAAHGAFVPDPIAGRSHRGRRARRWRLAVGNATAPAEGA